MIRSAMLNYSFGSASEACGYSIINAYFMLYLTTVLKIDSGIAGTIVALTLISEAVSAIIIGGASDRSTSPKGRRRPYIIISSIVLSLCLVISFTAFDFPDTVKIIYYTFFGIVMRGAFSAYYTTYVAFGAEILTDYDQRTRMRSICKLFSTAGNLIGYVLPLWIVGLLTRLNYSEAAGWSVAAMLVALITFFTAFICWKNTAPYQRKKLEKYNHVLKKTFSCDPSANIYET